MRSGCLRHGHHCIESRRESVVCGGVSCVRCAVVRVRWRVRWRVSCLTELSGHVLENDVAPVLHLLSILLGDKFVDPVEEIDVDLMTVTDGSALQQRQNRERERNRAPRTAGEANRLNALLLAQLLRPTLAEIERFVATLRVGEALRQDTACSVCVCGE